MVCIDKSPEFNGCHHTCPSFDLNAIDQATIKFIVHDINSVLLELFVHNIGMVSGFWVKTEISIKIIPTNFQNGNAQTGGCDQGRTYRF